MQSFLIPKQTAQGHRPPLTGSTYRSAQSFTYHGERVETPRTETRDCLGVKFLVQPVESAIDPQAV